MARDRWWRDVRRHVPERARPLVELVNAHPYFVPSFLVPDAVADHPGLSLRDELEAMLAVPEEQILAGLALYESVAGLPNPPRSLQRLRAEGSGYLHCLADAADALFHACLAADWPVLSRNLSQDVHRRAGQAISGGIGTVLNSLHPGLIWSGHSLHFTALGRLTRSPYGLSKTLLRSIFPKDTLSGRGFVLIPTLFGRDWAIPTVTPHGQPTLVYPVRSPTMRSASDTLAALIGPARARALRALAPACTTTELATRLHVTAPTASVHASTLRNAGLITTHRKGKHVLHVLTDLGNHLLLANPDGQNG